jgi:hypothetical protein
MIHDERPESVRRVVQHNTDAPQADSVPEHVIVENRTRGDAGVDPATVRDVLATLVDDDRRDGAS